jgi:hypothetical protein
MAGRPFKKASTNHILAKTGSRTFNVLSNSTMTHSAYFQTHSITMNLGQQMDWNSTHTKEQSEQSRH